MGLWAGAPEVALGGEHEAEGDYVHGEHGLVEVSEVVPAVGWGAGAAARLDWWTGGLAAAVRATWAGRREAGRAGGARQSRFSFIVQRWPSGSGVR